jgi:RHS repeat-associated protein
MLSRGTNCGWTLPFGLSEGDITRRVNSIVSYGTNLFIGGSQADFGGLGNVFSAKWDGSNLVEIGDGLDFTDSPICAAGYETEPGVQAVYVFNGDVYIGGDFTGTATLTQGGVNTNIQHVAKLAGASTNWSAVGTSKLNGRVSAIADLNNTLYVGGDFTAAGTNTAVRYLARLVNGDWQPVGPGVNGPVRALTAHNGRLFVGGEFTTAGGFTNANCIASWNGTAWTTINSGISDGTQDDPGNSCSAATRVEGIAARGSEIYICGDFTKAWNGDSAVSSRYVARAIWNETDQIWQWSGLAEGLRFDDGTGADDPSINGRAITIREFGNGTGYDVVVVGVFSEAGGLPANNAARWVVGQSECATTGPAVTVTSPTSGAKVSGTNFTFSGTAQSTGYTITQVEVFLNGGFLGTGNLDTSTNWSFVYTNLSPGPCTVKAVATDSNDKSAASAPITFTCVRTTGPTANADTFHVFSTGAATNLNVLANDVLTNGTPRIVGVNKWANPFAMMAGVGSVRIAYGATNLVYVANPYTFGTNVVSYDVADNGGTNTGIATVYVHALPRATINAPINGTIFPTNSITTNVIGTAQDFDGSISSVTLFVNGLQYGSPTTNSNFTNSFSTNVAGFYTLLAVATDNDGFTNGSPPVSITIDPPGGIPPFAEITSLLNDTTNFTTLVATNYPVVRDGFLTLIGSAYDPDGDSVTRQLLLFRPGELTQFANVTPGALDYFGFTSGAVTNGNLGTLNLSAIPNGVYDLVLVVRSRGDQSSDSVRFTLDNQLKIGAFSFSEQDLVIPVNGIALTVIRTYDSMNQVYADFGYNWTYALNDLDMVIDENRQTTNALVASGDDPYDGSANLFSLRTGGGRSVTLTLPGGQRTTFAFAPTFRDNFALAQWQSPPGVTATLTMITNNTIDFWGGAGLQNPYFRIAGPETPFEAFDIEGYYLTLKDGTVYELHRDPALGTPQWVSYLDGSGVPWSVSPYSGKPKLTNIRQRSGDTITINNGGIWHSPPGTTNATRTVLFDRDSQNRITAIHDPIGGTYPAVKYVYNQDSGNLIQVLRLLDRSAGSYTTNTYHYDNAAFPHFITEIDNPSGIPITRNQYDAGGRLIASTDANGNKVSYTHDLTNHLETVVDRLGHTNIFGYDTRGNIIANTNALGQVARFAFDDNNNKTNEVNALNQTNNYVFSTNSLLLVSIDPLGQSNSFTYNNFSQLASASDGRNNTTTNYYDSSGNLTAISNVFGLVATNVYSNALMVSSKDALGNITTNQYDQFGNLVNSAVIDTNNVTLTSVSYAYDSNNNRTNQTIIRTIPGGKQTNVTTYIYDGQSRLTQTIEPDGKTNIVVLNLAGQMQATTDKLGRTTSYEYDAVGNLSRVTYPDLTTESYAYDAEGRRAYLTNRLGYVTQYQYDALARLTNTIYPDLSTSTTVFDAAGRVAYIVDARGNTNAFGYDSAGRRTSVTNAYGTAIQMVTTYAYDPAGNQTNMVLVASNLTSSYFYDALNRRTNVTFQDGTKIVTRFDAAGHRIAETDQATNTTQFAYDGLGRLTAVTNALGKVTKYQYDEAGNVTNQVDALNRSTKFEYDTMGRRTKRTLPANQVETFGYDPAGNLLAYTNFNSLILTNQYDVMNRLWKRWNGSTLLETYSYDAVGQLTNRLDTSGNYGWVFDKRGRATTNSTPVATLYYQYDLNGNLTNLNSSTASGVSVGYQYDALNRITNVIDNRLSGTKNTSYTFDGVGNLQSLKYPNGLTNLWQYDSLNRLTNLTWKLNGAQRGDFTYKLGPAGNRTNLVDNVSGTSRTFAWQYDPLYRLTNEVISGGTPTGTLGYVYDDVGNRTSRTGTVGSLSATNNTFDINDWLDNDSTTNNANPYFDANGNQRTNGSNVYLYNYANRLTNANSGAVVIVYGADGNRVKKTTSTTTTIYLVATVNPTGYPQVVEDLTVSGGTTNLSRVYTYGLDLISQRQISGTVVTFYGYDGLGSVRFLTEGTGAITNTYAYDAFGTVIASNTPVANVYLYSGEQWDPDLGLYYLRARLMNPSNGRFLSMDTFEGSNEDPLSLHKYLYTVNPVNTVDPSGRSGLTEVLTVAGIGATLGALTTEAATYAYQGRAATTIEIFQGALYGAGFAVGGWAVPVFGVGVAAYGVGTAAINGYSVLADPNVSWQRKSTAVALFIASAYGTQKAVDYAKVMRGYVPSNPKGASLIPESYMNRIGAVDMRAAPPGSKSNAAGFPLNGAWFFRQLLRQHPEWFSPRNRGLIREGRAPEVDATWVAQFPEHGGYLGSGLRHHHILQGPIAVPVPEPVHVGWSGSLHPAVPNTTVPPGAAGGIAGGLVEETTSDDN